MNSQILAQTMGGRKGKRTHRAALELRQVALIKNVPQGLLEGRNRSHFVAL
jgi:hypothetical protein